MFEKTVAALAAVEEAVKEEIQALWAPEAGAPWHGAGAGILQQTFAEVGALRTKLEAQDPAPPEPAPEAPAPEEAPADPATAPETPAEAPTEVPATEPVNPSPVTEPAQEANTTTQEVLTVNA